MSNNNDKKHDPFAEREAQKYERPVPSREFILEKLQGTTKPVTLKAVCKMFELTDDESVEGIRRRLKAMVRDQQLIRGEKFGFALPREGETFADNAAPREAKTKEIKLVEAKVILDRQNQLWAQPLRGGPKIALSQGDQRKLSVGNKIVVSVSVNSGRQPSDVVVGRLVDIVEKQELIITGRYSEVPYPHIVPFSRDVHQDIFVSDINNLDPQQDQIIVVEITNDLTTPDQLKGIVVEILGDNNTKGIEILAAIRQYDLPYEWPDEVLEQALDVADTIADHSLNKRLDLRQLPLITIDGEDARDFDDAVYCQANGSGFMLYVAIADVSFYVKTDTALDIEAKLRGNSVYFPARVIPMLPEKLSNNMCSLMPNVDRLCMVCQMEINAAGEVTDYKFYEAVMHSQARLTYTKVAMMLDGDDILRRQYQDVWPVVIELDKVYQALNTARQKRGAIDFDTVETKVVYGKDGKISDIIPIKRNVAHKIIEECMLAANVSTAAFLEKNEALGIYRNHEGPASEKLPDLKTFLRELGLSLGTKGEPVTPLDYGTLLSLIKDRPDYKIIQTVLLRSLSQAVYSPDNIGHFGLAYEAYTHFTSPIRRYPDLIVHRQIKNILHQSSEKLSFEDLQKIAMNCSQTERRADDATRDVMNRLKCIFMKDKVGQTFNGVISGVTRFGLFVEIEDFYIDGLIHISDLGTDYFHYNQIHHKLEGEKTGQVYSLGMSVVVVVSAVNPDENKIDLNLVSQQGERVSKDTAKGKARSSKKDKK